MYVCVWCCLLYASEVRKVCSDVAMLIRFSFVLILYFNFTPWLHCKSGWVYVKTEINLLNQIPSDIKHPGWNLYSTYKVFVFSRFHQNQSLFTCLGNFPRYGLPSVIVEISNSNLGLRQNEKWISKTVPFNGNSSFACSYLSFETYCYTLPLARTHGRAKVSAEMFDGIFLPEPGEHLFN